jgi:hypothetical protein
MIYFYFTSVIGFLSDIALGFAAIFTAYTAHKGLKSWKNELAGKAKFETAQTLRIRALILRDRISRCRSPLISAHEFPEGYTLPNSNEIYTARISTQKFEAFRHVYQNRWASLAPALQDCEESAIHAEVILGGSVKDTADALVKCADRLQISIAYYLDDIRNRGRDFESDIAYGRKIKHDVNSTSSPEDVLTQDIDEALLNLQSLCGKYLNKQEL